MAKKYTKSQITGGHGASLIAERVFSMGHVYQATGDLEAGIDGYIEIRDPETEEATGLTVAVQSKATAGRFTAETDERFEYLLDERDLDYWLSGNLPVLLVVSRPQSGEAYYKSIKEYFSSPERRKDRKVVFDKQADRFDESASGELVALARPQDSGLYVSPVPNDEALLSNLLPVRRYPETVYHAETDYRDPGRIWSEAKDKGLDVSGEWFLHDKRIWCIHDLREEPFRRFCRPETTEPDALSRWADTADRDLKWNFVRLMKECLGERLRRLRVGYNRDKGLYYFWAPHDLSKRKAQYRHHSGSRHHHTVFKGYPEHSSSPDDIHFYRHAAFEGYFERIDGQWHLKITPSYLFTTDGRENHPGGGKLVSNIKRFEKHEAVRSQIEFWAYQLRRSDFASEYPHLTFDPLRSFSISQGIDDAMWRASGSVDEEPSAESTSDSQQDLFD